MSRSRPALACAVAALTLLAAGCGRAGGADPAPDGGTGALEPRLVVLAASSLTDAFTEIGERFEREHPGTEVVLSFGGSPGLVQQVLAGVPADVLVTAGTASAAGVADAGLADGAPVVVARNAVALAVPTGNPAGVGGLADLADPGLRLALCAPEVPCGAAATEALHRAGVEPRPDTLERDVRAVLTKVALGEVDAGVVYRTDIAAAADEVVEVPLPEAQAARVDYPLVVLADAPAPRAARAFADLVRSPRGRDALAGAGFVLP